MKDKTQPLKGKLFYLADTFGYCKKEDIRSAVEWLKKELYESFIIAKEVQENITDKQLNETLKLIGKAIDKAFEDVMK